MARTTVTKLFVSSTLACIFGGIFVAVGWFAFAHEVFVIEGSGVTGVRRSPFAWIMFGLGVTGVLALISALLASLAAWVGALLNTARLERKTWFVALALLGLLHLSLLAVLAYIVAGPDPTDRVSAAATSGRLHR